MPRRHKYNWSEKEIETLEILWGNQDIWSIGKRLGRTAEAVRCKAETLGIGGPVRNRDYLTVADIANYLGVRHESVISSWIKIHKLKARKFAPFGKREFWRINQEDLLAWLEANQDKWDASKLEPYIFGVEPEWIVEKRKRDTMRPVRRWQTWTDDEISMAVALFKAGKTYSEIGERLFRSARSVQMKLFVLGLLKDNRRSSRAEGGRK